jgi:hypothetical protein
MLFVHDLDDLHQWDFLWNLRLREFVRSIDNQRQDWKRRASKAEERLAQFADTIPNTPSRQNVSDDRYATLRRYLAKKLHPDFAPDTTSKKWSETRFSRRSGSR